MRYCYSCGHTTGGEPWFCNSCGRSYDVKLCQKLHVNPRTAQACSHCGSRDLSTPQPKVPLSWRLLAFLAQILWGLVLLCLSVPVVIEFLTDLRMHAKINDRLLLVAFPLAILWSAWTVLPACLRRIIHRSLAPKR